MMLRAGEDDDVISVHSTLVIGGYLGCTGVAIFSIVLPVLTPGPTKDDGALRFISEGMDAHCGLASLSLGISSLLLVACQLVAALHMATRNAAAWCVLAQTVAWFTVMAVSETGWAVHYAALGVFLTTNLVYHFLASHDATFGGRMYRLGLWLCVFFTLVFGALATATIADGGGNATLRSSAVSYEFTLMFGVLILNTFIVTALDQFRDIRMRFER